jgi:hypothetical protein
MSAMEPLDGAGLVAAMTTTAPSADEMGAFMRGEVPSVEEKAIGNQAIEDMMKAVGSGASETELEQQAGGISQESLDAAEDVANQNSAAFESAVDQTRAQYAGIEKESEKAASKKGQDGARVMNTVTIARLAFTANRYQREAHYNQALADLLEIEVRRQGFLSDRHRIRSKEFFYGMLGAQAGVTISTFSLAVRRRNLLWGLAASAGLAAVTFAAYVYMFV